jgi:hypothetical protein
MPHYKVKWTIDVFEENPEAAARKAREIQIDPGNTANFFQIENQETGTSHDIDLEYIDEVGKGATS